MSINVQEFFPEINNNLTKIKWSHATNSKAQLEQALASNDVMMIEGDVVMGKLKLGNGTEVPELVPIMAHPPKDTSDLVLSEFIKHITSSGQKQNSTKKGIKLDFKTIEAFEAAALAVDSHNIRNVPIMVNADILRGPENATSDPLPVDAKRFLQQATTMKTQPMLSIGWTTRYVAPVGNASISGNYTDEQINEMLKVVKESVKTNQSITYPVRACFAANSIEALKKLLEGTPANNNATLTIWSSEGDKVDAEKLSKLVNTIGITKVYVDVPKDILDKLNFNSAFTAQSSIFVVLASMIIALFSAKLL